MKHAGFEQSCDSEAVKKCCRRKKSKFSACIVGAVSKLEHIRKFCHKEDIRNLFADDPSEHPVGNYI